jgi:hypothetical protein
MDRFLVIFSSAVAFTALCGILMGIIAVFGPNPQTPPIASLVETLKYLFTVGGISIYTMLGTLPRRSNWS